MKEEIIEARQMNKSKILSKEMFKERDQLYLPSQPSHICIVKAQSSEHNQLENLST